MGQTMWKNAGGALRVCALIAMLALRSPCHGQTPSAEPAGWTSLGSAIQTTATSGKPTLVVVTSQKSPESKNVKQMLLLAPEAANYSQVIQFSELPAETSPVSVKNMRVTKYPTYIVYRRAVNGEIEVASYRVGIADSREVFAWINSLGLKPIAPAAQALTAAPTTAASAPPAPSRTMVDPAVERVVHSPQPSLQYPSGQAYPTEQSPQTYPPPPSKQPVMAPPPYSPQQPYCPPQPQPPAQPVFVPQQPQYVPAPQPYYLQSQTPAMVVQQAPQQIVLAPPPPPQVTVAMAPAPVAYAPAPQPNLFTQPMQAPQPQPMQAPQPMYAPQPQPMQAPQPQPMQAPQPQPMQAPQQQFGQAPSQMMLQAPGLLDNMLGAFGDILSRRRNPRVQMSPMPTLTQAPVANAPVMMAPGYGQAPYGYAPMTGYAPVGPPMQLVTPESTSFAPCNTYNAPCRYHGGPCPGQGGGGGYYGPQNAPYPTPSPQSGNAPTGKGFGLMNWWNSHR
jgi:hypothetical protein